MQSAVAVSHVSALVATPRKPESSARVGNGEDKCTRQLHPPLSNNRTPRINGVRERRANQDTDKRRPGPNSQEREQRGCNGQFAGARVTGEDRGDRSEFLAALANEGEERSRVEHAIEPAATSPLAPSGSRL